VSVIRKMPRSSPQERKFSCSAGESGGGRNHRSVVVNGASERRLACVMASPEAAALSCYSSLESECPQWTYLGSSSPYQLSCPPEAASFGSEVSWFNSTPKNTKKNLIMYCTGIFIQSCLDLGPLRPTLLPFSLISVFQCCGLRLITQNMFFASSLVRRTDFFLRAFQK
jgi:hypothetical protein